MGKINYIKISLQAFKEPYIMHLLLIAFIIIFIFLILTYEKSINKFLIIKSILYSFIYSFLFTHGFVNISLAKIIDNQYICKIGFFEMLLPCIIILISMGFEKTDEDTYGVVNDNNSKDDKRTWWIVI